MTELEYKLNCADDFDAYEAQWFNTPKLRKDFDVYRISDCHVAKLVKGHDFWRRYDEETRKARINYLINECLLHNQAYQLGISVPKPEGLFKVKIITEDSRITAPAFVMEYVEGVNLFVLGESSDDFDSAMTRRDEELEKARDLGFIPQDFHCENTIWNPERKKLYLIDLAKWRTKK